MRFAFILPYAGMAGGIRVIAVYADRLRRRGHEVNVVSTPQRQIPLHRKIKSVMLGRGWPKGPLPEPSYFENLAVPHRVISSYRPIVDADVPDGDVVIATHWTTAPWVEALSQVKGAKAIFIQGYEAMPGEANAALDASWTMPFHKIVISRWLVESAAQRFGDADVSHVPNSVALEQFYAIERGRKGDPTVGLLYSTSPFKACHVSLEAFDLLRRHMPKVRLVAFGADQPVERLPLPPGTEFHCRPAQEKIRDIYAKCDVWLCGSVREGFHLPPLEAMACRCPVVSTRVGGPMDIVEEGVNGHLVNVGDSGALADRLLRVLTLPEEQWKQMSDAALATATRYSWDDATGLFEAALEKAVEKNRRRLEHRAQREAMPA